MSLRTFITRAVVAAALFGTALVSVGLTAPEDGPFSIAIRPVFLHVDPNASDGSRARAFGVHLDLKLGLMRYHAAWSAIPVQPASTNPGPALF